MKKKNDTTEVDALKDKLKIGSFLYKFILILALLYICNIKFEYNILINIILNKIR